MMLSCQMVSNIGPGVNEADGNVQTEGSRSRQPSIKLKCVQRASICTLTQGTEESIWQYKRMPTCLEVHQDRGRMAELLRSICGRKHPQRGVSQGKGNLQEFRSLDRQLAAAMSLSNTLQEFQDKTFESKAQAAEPMSTVELNGTKCHSSIVLRVVVTFTSQERLSKSYQTLTPAAEAL